MKVRLLPSSVSAGASNEDQYLTSYLINDALAVDAGSIGLFGSPQEQARIRHVLLSHTHLDHVASLAVFLENVYQAGSQCVVVHGSEAVLDSLQRDVFNNRLWPDFIALSTGQPPFLKLATLHSGQPVELEGLRITPVAVDHSVPTMGFILEDGVAAVVIASDTGPTQALWDHANRTHNLKAVFLETSFPEEMTPLAEVAGHLTVALAAREVQKIKHPVTVLAVHLKAQFRDRVVQELQALGLPRVELARFDREYEF
jgi:ribonuclease BN (tRNA processing enzyme)